MIPMWLSVRQLYETEEDVHKNWQLRGGIFGRLLMVFLDLINGLWSGFPLCCVFAFVRDGLLYGHRPHAKIRFLQCVYDDADYEHWLAQSGYVQCKTCFKARYHLPKRVIRDGGVPVGWLLKEKE